MSIYKAQLRSALITLVAVTLLVLVNKHFLSRLSSSTAPRILNESTLSLSLDSESISEIELSRLTLVSSIQLTTYTLNEGLPSLLAEVSLSESQDHRNTTAAFFTITSSVENQLADTYTKAFHLLDLYRPLRPLHLSLDSAANRALQAVQMTPYQRQLLLGKYKTWVYMRPYLRQKYWDPWVQAHRKMTSIQSAGKKLTQEVEKIKVLIETIGNIENQLHLFVSEGGRNETRITVVRGLWQSVPHVGEDLQVREFAGWKKNSIDGFDLSER